MRWAFVPTGEFREVPMPDGATYADAAVDPRSPTSRTIRRYGLPPGFAPRAGEASVFFIHPTSFLRSSALERRPRRCGIAEQARLFVLPGERVQFGQCHLGAQISPSGVRRSTSQDARRAVDFAWRDVRAAYEAFLRQAPADRPIILAAHSQGSLHLLRLLEERIRGAPEADRIAAAYVVGWPVSETADLPALPLPACERPDQAHCLLSWQSFSEPADPKMVTDAYDASVGPGGVRRAKARRCCASTR